MGEGTQLEVTRGPMVPAIVVADDVIAPFAAESETVGQKAAVLKIANSDDEKAAVECLDAVADVLKRADEVRQGIVSPHRKYVDEVNAKFKAALASLGVAEVYLKDEIKGFRRREREREERERREKEEADRGRRAEAEALAKANIPPATIAQVVEAPKPMPVPAVSGTTRSSSGAGATGKQVPKFVVLDASKVPDAYKIVVDSLVVSAVKAKVSRQATEEKPDTTTIPGVAAYWDEDIVRAGRR